jgi:hypothetical protein
MLTPAACATSRMVRRVRGARAGRLGAISSTYFTAPLSRPET